MVNRATSYWWRVIGGIAISISAVTSGVRAQFPDHIAAPEVDRFRGLTPFFEDVPEEFNQLPVFFVKVTDLIDRDTCFEANKRSDKRGQAASSAYAIATIPKRRVPFHPKYWEDTTIKLCLETGGQRDVRIFRVGDEGMVIGREIVDGHIVPLLQSESERIAERRRRGGWCVLGFCVGGRSDMRLMRAPDDVVIKPRPRDYVTRQEEVALLATVLLALCGIAAIGFWAVRKIARSIMRIVRSVRTPPIA